MVVGVAVIGAGIVGLSTAVAIQQRLPNSKVTVIADRFGRHTTSDGSGGLFCPWAKGGVPEEVSHRWASEGAKHFFDLAFSSESGVSGVNLITGFELTNTEDEPLPYLKYAAFHEKMSSQLLQQFKPFYKYGYVWTTAVIECPKYLPWLMNKFLSNGGSTEERKVKSFDELCGKYDVIVNCAGLGSKDLTSDPGIASLRGHIIRVSAPWIKHFVHSDDGNFIIPSSETIAVCGVKQPDRYDMDIDPSDSRQIWKDMRARFPALEGAKVLWEWIGLRPQRDRVRLESEVIRSKGQNMKVVHNYGHGAFGVSLSWGTAVHASELVEQLVNNSRAKL